MSTNAMSPTGDIAKTLKISIEVMDTIPQNYWETEVKVLDTDIDRLGHVNNVVYLRYVQEVAESHWNGIATPTQLQTSIWVVRRHEIDYSNPILPGYPITGLTWVHRPEGTRFHRSVWMVSPDRKTIYAKAKTTWLLLDNISGRPKRVEDALLVAFEKWMV
jgi:acyl-CoA thioester hydrolase